jgi:hypothetical protein
VYATVLNSKSNSDGYKEEGILYPSGSTHKLLLDECYHECGADKNLLNYFEGHGTGTRVSTVEGQIKASLCLASLEIRCQRVLWSISSQIWVKMFLCSVIW